MSALLSLRKNDSLEPHVIDHGKMPVMDLTLERFARCAPRDIVVRVSLGAPERRARA